MRIHSGENESKLRLEPRRHSRRDRLNLGRLRRPGCRPARVDSTTWSDHTDVRPTILELVGLNDDYVHDGRVISEILEGYARPLALKKSTSFVALAQVYKQLNAPFGAFAMATLRLPPRRLPRTTRTTRLTTLLMGRSRLSPCSGIH